MKIFFLALTVFLAVDFYLKAEACSYCPSGTSCSPKCQSSSCQGQGCPSGCGCVAVTKNLASKPYRTLPAGTLFKCEDGMAPFQHPSNEESQNPVYQCPEKPLPAPAPQN